MKSIFYVITFGYISYVGKLYGYIDYNYTKKVTYYDQMAKEVGNIDYSKKTSYDMTYSIYCKE